LEREEHLLQKEEDEAVERKKQAAAQLAAEKGLTRAEPRSFIERKPQVAEDDVYEASPSKATCQHVEELEDKLHVSKRGDSQRAKSPQPDDKESPEKTDFVPARLPHF